MTTSWQEPAVSAGFDSYDDYVEHRLAYIPLIRDLKELYAGEAIVLDYGCGSGKVTRRLLETQAAASVIGVDISADMIRLAEARKSQEAARFQTIESARIPYPDSTFDAVVCCFVFINVPTRDELHRIAEELARVLRPSGMLFIIDSNPTATGIQFPTFRSGEPGRDYRDGDKRKVSLEIPDAGVLELVDRHWSIGTYESVLTAAGFTIGEITARGSETADDVGAQSPVDHPPFLQIRARVNTPHDTAAEVV